jgi:TolA-binding protein
MPASCQNCGSSLDGKRRSARYCSDACRQAAFRARKSKEEPAAPLVVKPSAVVAPPQPPPQPQPVQVQVQREVVQVADPALVQRLGMLERQLRQAQAKISALEGAGPRVEDVSSLQRQVAGLREWRKEVKGALTEHERGLASLYHKVNGVNSKITTLANSVAEYAGKRSWFG